MKTLPGHSLKAFNSFGVEARAGALLQIESTADVERLDQARSPVLLLGGGSNTLFAGDVEGSVGLVRIPGRRILGRDAGRVLVEVAAGENWHEFVTWTLDQGLAGLENLSLIPGLAGAAPMQNIGAYGVELAERLDSVGAWDRQRRAWVRLAREDCGFAYRDSRFKSGEPERFVITDVRLALDTDFTPRLEYAGLREELARLGVKRPDARAVSDAVIRIRRRKLPDPAQQGNAGSFFKNPEIPATQASALRERFGALPVYPTRPGRAKLAAAWLIEACGWKGRALGPAAVSDQHALVLVNRGGARGADILGLASRIAADVAGRFGVQLEPEPRIVGASAAGEAAMAAPIPRPSSRSDSQ